MNRSIRLKEEYPGATVRGALIALALAVVFSLIFYTCNTPLGPAIGSDNAMYLTMGTALSQGYAPYSEIFDHKGPLLFLLQMLPQLVGGGYSTLAVFAQEVCFLAASLLAVAAIALVVTLVHKSWYARYMAGFEAAAECVLEHAAAGEEA